jgi:FkbM family methyltransferase
LDLEAYWMSTDLEIFSRLKTEIEKFRNILCDEDSRALLSSILNYRRSGELRFLPSPRPLTEQYLADDLATPPIKLRVIDLGACQGENLSNFIESGREFVAGFLLEPDLKNIELLKIRLAELNLTNLECHALGAWSETTTLSFDASGTTGASLSAKGGEKVKVVALDDFIPLDFIPNLVKMDIEGAELEAINGMSRIIESYSPHLAISVYHKPTDLWTLGNILSDRFPNKYNYYLRNYGHQTFDTVLYAVPKISLDTTTFN